jgi:hypothetical protein
MRKFLIISMGMLLIPILAVMAIYALNAFIWISLHIVIAFFIRLTGKPPYLRSHLAIIMMFSTAVPIMMYQITDHSISAILNPKAVGLSIFSTAFGYMLSFIGPIYARLKANRLHRLAMRGSNDMLNKLEEEWGDTLKEPYSQRPKLPPRIILSSK